MEAMAPPRVSAFAAYQKAKQETKPQLGLEKKKKGSVSKSPQKVLKKKKSKSKELLRNSEPQEEANCRVSYPIKKKSLCKKGKTPNKIANGKALRLHRLKSSENSNKQHVGPPLDSVLQNLGRIQNSKERANTLFEWLISPVKPDDFFRCIWEKKPALLKRHNSKYYNGFFSTSEFDRILREDNVQFGVNLDVTSYTDGVRETHNPPGRALPMVVWDYYKNGCSLRLLNPQSFSSTVWNVLSVLQELFGSMVGANTYLTPPSTQGFAPHYDDIEAFVVQLEGKKHWRVYNPRNSSEILPQFSSVNFSDSDLGEPILETILEAGDLLYFPRGFIHQGDCLPYAHSLHITVSSFQRNSWVDLLDKLLPAALQIAAEDDVQFRQGLPLDYLDYMGVQNAELNRNKAVSSWVCKCLPLRENWKPQSDPRRGNFREKVQFLISKLAEYAPIDAAVDQKAKTFLYDCLPPVLTPAEKSHSVYGAPARWENGDVTDGIIQLEKDTQIRFLRSGIVRLCSEGEACLLYYSTENSRVYHQEAPKSMEVDAEHMEAIEYLIHCYPQYATVESLPCEDLDDKLAVANMLFEKGLLTTKERLTPLSRTVEIE
ncbi:ribosomal oxygenase 1 isoform X2 [Dendrobates tinctorius]|uniref:ribosomal oxygenase 1 isoform X2 n=1 Tax=Dendrobates tinctorius TaxID=92724 RepID=UPI003CCA0C44